MFEDELEGFNYLENRETQNFHSSSWNDPQHAQSIANHSSNRPHRSPNPVNLAGSLHDTPLSTLNRITLHTGVNPNEMDSFFSQYINAQSDKDWQLNDGTKYQKDGIPLNADQYIGDYKPSSIRNNSNIRIRATLGLRSMKISITNNLSRYGNKTKNIFEDKQLNYDSIKTHLDRHARMAAALNSKTKLLTYKEMEKLMDKNRKNIVEWADGDEYFADRLLKYSDDL